jgi:hypothetical protein
MSDSILFINKFLTSSEITSSILMGWTKTQLWSTISYCITLLLQCFVILSLTNISSDSSYTKYITDLYNNGMFMFVYLLIILIIYSYAIYHSNERIKENEMPKGWTYRSWITSVLMMMITFKLFNHIPNIVNKQQQDNSMLIILCHVLFIFVYIQYIISYYYQTDGFISL